MFKLLLHENKGWLTAYSFLCSVGMQMDFAQLYCGALRIEQMGYLHESP